MDGIFYAAQRLTPTGNDRCNGRGSMPAGALTALQKLLPHHLDRDAVNH